MYKSLEELCEIAKEQDKKIYEIVLEEDCHERGVSVEDGFSQVKQVYLAMKEADKEYDGTITSTSKLAGGDGERLRLSPRSAAERIVAASHAWSAG